MSRRFFPRLPVHRSGVATVGKERLAPVTYRSAESGQLDGDVLLVEMAPNAASLGASTRLCRETTGLSEGGGTIAS